MKYWFIFYPTFIKKFNKHILMVIFYTIILINIYNNQKQC